MDPRVDMCHVVLTSSRIVEECSNNESFCALLALAGVEPFCDKWGRLDPTVYNIDMLRHWQTTSYINLHNHTEELRIGPYGVLLRHRLNVANLYSYAVLSSRLPVDMIELVLKYIRDD